MSPVPIHAIHGLSPSPQLRPSTGLRTTSSSGNDLSQQLCYNPERMEPAHTETYPNEIAQIPEDTPRLDTEEPANEDLQAVVQTCSKCHVANHKKNGIKCAECDTYFHVTYLRITRQQAANIPRWLCQACRGVTPARGRFVFDENFYLPEFISARRVSTRVVQFIPKGARALAATSMKNLLTKVVETNSILDWTRLLAFPLCALYIPEKNGKGRPISDYQNQMSDEHFHGGRLYPLSSR